jgi:hypothetical protein
VNGLFFGPRPSISLQGTPRALSTSVTVLPLVASAAVERWAVGRG